MIADNIETARQAKAVIGSPASLATPWSPKQPPSGNRRLGRSDRQLQGLLAPQCSHADPRPRVGESRLQQSPGPGGCFDPNGEARRPGSGREKRVSTGGLGVLSQLPSSRTLTKGCPFTGTTRNDAVRHLLNRYSASVGHKQGDARASTGLGNRSRIALNAEDGPASRVRCKAARMPPCSQARSRLEQSRRRSRTI